MGIVASTLLAIQIKVFELLFNVLAEKLTQWENHKLQGAHYNSWAMKLFVFYCINYYYAFFHIMIFQRMSPAGCPPGGCLHMLKTQLFLVYISVLLSEVVQVKLCELGVWFSQTQELYFVRQRLRKEAAERGEEYNGEVPILSLLEVQAKFCEYKEREQIQTMTQMVISLGFLLLFGAVAPIMTLPCVCVFACYFRMNARQLTHSAKRPFPWNLSSIGSWTYAMEVLRGAGVFVTAFLLVTQEGVFEGADITAKLFGALAFICAARVTRPIVNVVLACPDDSTSMLSHRQTHVLNMLRKVILESTPSTPGGSTSASSLRKVPSNVKSNVDWAALPTLVSAPDSHSSALLKS